MTSLVLCILRQRVDQVEGSLPLLGLYDVDAEYPSELVSCLREHVLLHRSDLPTEAAVFV